MKAPVYKAEVAHAVKLRYRAVGGPLGGQTLMLELGETAVLCFRVDGRTVRGRYVCHKSAQKVGDIGDAVWQEQGD